MVYKDEYIYIIGWKVLVYIRMNIYYWLEGLGVYKDEYILLAGRSWCI